MDVVDVREHMCQAKVAVELKKYRKPHQLSS